MLTQKIDFQIAKIDFKILYKFSNWIELCSIYTNPPIIYKATEQYSVDSSTSEKEYRISLSVIYGFIAFAYSFCAFPITIFGKPFFMHRPRNWRKTRIKKWKKMMLIFWRPNNLKLRAIVLAIVQGVSIKFLKKNKKKTMQV